MKEITCPKCGNVIKMDDADYAMILAQVKNDEFETQLSKKAKDLQKQMEATMKAQLETASIKMQQQISEKNGEIAQLRTQLAEVEKSRSIEMEKVELEKEIEAKKALDAKEQEIVKLKKQVDDLKAKTSDVKKDINLAVMEEREKNNAVIADLKEQMSKEREENAKKEQKSSEERQEMKTEYEVMVRNLQDEVERVKNFKSKKSVKLIGEDLEQHCLTLYNSTLATVLPDATFEKDNTVAEGTKGDFTLRYKPEGIDVLSVMFEMKNESDGSATKHKNADFFGKLDSDRKKKGCEYAVLVSMLELENDLYNNGIYAVPGYDKMYVVRPDCFITIIALLIQMSRNTLAMQKELIESKNQSVDVTNFESKLQDFKKGFMANYERAKGKFDDAIAQIDKSISDLQKVKESLLSSENQLRLANDKADRLTIKSLTRGNTTMKNLFDQARQTAGNAEVIETESAEQFL